MLNPPNPLEHANPTSALNLLHTPIPKDPFNPGGVVSAQSAGLAGKSYRYQTFAAVNVPWRPKSLFVIMSFHGEGADELATVRDECNTLGLTATRVDDTTGSDFVIKQFG